MYTKKKKQRNKTKLPHFRVTAQREIEQTCSRAEERYFELSKREAGQGGSRGNCPPTVFLKERAVKFVIPNRELNQSQLKAIERIIDYGNLNNVKIEIDIMLK